MQGAASIESYFAADYLSARTLFLEASKTVNTQVQSHRNPFSDDVELAMDVTRIGPMEARRLLVMTSGTHGAELMCGSGCQVGHLRSGCFESLPSDCAVLLVHGVNPWGARFLRRNTEDNVDLCRNFLNFDEPYPANQDYVLLHGDLLHADIGTLDDFVTSKIATLGIGRFMNALMGGQYEFADGYGYGGNRPCWSNQVLRSVLQEHARAAEQVCIVDYHSGVGPYGYGSAVCMQQGDALSRARRWFGGWLIAPRAAEGPEEFHRTHGHAADGYADELDGRELTTVVLEFGTFDVKRNIRALLADHIARFGASVSTEARKTISAEAREIHFPDDAQWRRAVWDRATQVVDQALLGLTGGV